MLKRNSWMAIAIFFLTTMTFGMTGFDQAGQEKPPQTQTPEERRKMMEKIMQEIQKNAPQTVQPPTAPETPAQAAPQAAPVPRVAERAPLAGGQIRLTYDNAELYEFINQITDTLGLSPVIIDPEVKGSVTIHSPLPMSREDVFPLFNLILKNNNAALVKEGDIYQVVPLSVALKRGLPIIDHMPPAPPPEAPKEPPQKKETPSANAGEAAAAETRAVEAKPAAQKQPPVPAAAKTPPPAPRAAEQAAPQAQAIQPVAQRQETRPASISLATHVIRVEFVPVRDLIEPLKLFMTDGGVIMPYERLNMLIVTDYSDSVAKVLDIIDMLDSSYLDPDLIELVEIKNNASADVLADMQKIFGGGKDSSTGIFMISLDRINAILIMANSKRALGEAKRWIARLDATTGRNMQTYVYTVKNSTASNIAMILSLLYGGEGGAAGGGYGGGGYGGGVTGGGGYSGARTAGLQSAAQGGGGGTVTPFGSTGGGAQTSMGGYAQQGGGTFGGGTFGGGAFGGGAYGGGAFGGFGGGGFYGGQQLGPRLNQGVGVSAQILKGGAFAGLQDVVRLVADDLNNSLIIQASPADYASLLEIIEKMDVLPRQVIIDARIFEVDLTDNLSFGVAASLQARTGDPRNTAAAIAGDTGAFSLNTFAFIGNSRELLMALNALRTKTKVKVLEAPAVLALDGTAAKVVVGGEVPYPGASYIAPAGGSSTSVQYRETGIALIIMPRISASGTVTLDVAHEISAPGVPTDTGPTFTKTSVSTTLAVKDGETVAIAGLIRENDSVGRNGIPILSDIPLLGALFGQTTRSKTRTELLILLTPHVIRTPERFQEMTQEIRDSLRNVRPFVDEHMRNLLEDREQARKERMRLEQKEMKQQEVPSPEPPQAEPPKTEPPKPEPPPDRR